MKFSIVDIMIVLGLTIFGIVLYHNGILNIIAPGFKTVSRKKAKAFSAFVADCSNTASQNLGSSGSLYQPQPLPVTNTWGGEIEVDVRY